MRTQHRLAAAKGEPPARASARRTLGATLSERARAYIGRHVRDADLSVEKIAAALGCSKRYLHLVFNAGDETISEYVWRQRLEGCRAELGDPAHGLTLTETAYAWGFNSSAHFSRAFKARYGVSPSAHRLSGRSCVTRQNAFSVKWPCTQDQDARGAPVSNPRQSGAERSVIAVPRRSDLLPKEFHHG